MGVQKSRKLPKMAQKGVKRGLFGGVQGLFGDAQGLFGGARHPFAPPGFVLGLEGLEGPAGYKGRRVQKPLEEMVRGKGQRFVGSKV